MKFKKRITLYILPALLSVAATANTNSKQTSVSNAETAMQDTTKSKKNVIDEVIWIVGDEPILKSDVEVMRLQSEMSGEKWDGNPDCLIPERIALQKLFLHQAAIDSIQVSEAEISQNVEAQISSMLQMVGGSKEKLEEYRHQTLIEMRQELREEVKDYLLTQRMKESIVKDIKVTPAEVREFFRTLPQDSIPFVPTEVEIEKISSIPHIKQEEIDRVKGKLREFTDRINKNETSFATLARFYSEDPGSARQGGELDYAGRGMFDPAFASVAFNLTDPNKISKIVESEYGYHIIQLIDKRGDKIKVRHILLKPNVSQDEIDKSIHRLDSIANDIRGTKFSFEEAATFLSDDKDTKNNKGLMANLSERSSKFKMKELPPEIARVADTLKVGQVSKAFSMINDKGKTECVIIKLKNRIEGHPATITEDFQVMKAMVEAKKREKTLEKWVQDKLKSTYVRMNGTYKESDFKYKGWIK